MKTRDFIKMVADGSPDGAYEYVAIESKSHSFQGRTGNLWSDTCLGFSWAKRTGKGGDWKLGDEPVLAIKTVKLYDRMVACAVIDQLTLSAYVQIPDCEYIRSLVCAHSLCGYE